jgi:hypothetical protein
MNKKVLWIMLVLIFTLIAINVNASPLYSTGAKSYTGVCWWFAEDLVEELDQLMTVVKNGETIDGEAYGRSLREKVSGGTCFIVSGHYYKLSANADIQELNDTLTNAGLDMYCIDKIRLIDGRGAGQTGYTFRGFLQVKP